MKITKKKTQINSSENVVIESLYVINLTWLNANILAEAPDVHQRVAASSMTSP